MTDIRRPVFMSGENPGMTLYEPGTEKILAVASYWHCTDTPLGPGHALVLWTGNGDGNACRATLSDNLPLAKRLVENLTQHFPEFQGIPILDYPYIESFCGHEFDGERYRARCRSKSLEIELEWTGPMDRKQIIWSRFPAGRATFDLTTVICPCRSAHVLVNGTPIAGEAKTTEAAEGHPTSSAFLAFAETWIGPL